MRLSIAGLFILVLLARQLARAASYVLYVTLGVWALNAWVLKPLFARARPEGADRLASVSDTFSLPSGHSASAAGVFLAIALIASTLWWRRRPRRMIWMVACAAVFLVGISRVWLGAHWPTDVLIGWLVGAGWAALLAAVLRPVLSPTRR
jgi:undecaprenyl-diphosphatase